MRDLKEMDFLDLWERGCPLHPIDRGLLAVHTAFPQTRTDSVADWPLGRRNRALAEVHTACFGRMLRGWVSCPQCSEELEFSLDGQALIENPLPQDEPVVVDGRAFHLPTSRNLASIATEPDLAVAAMRLAELCSLEDLSARHERNAADLDSIGQQMALADPLAEIILHFDCPACAASFDDSLDLSSFLWAEFEAQAIRVLRDVHTLASAYGWSEAQILSLSSTRRRAFIKMVHT